MKRIINKLRLYSALILITGLTNCDTEPVFDEHGITTVTIVDAWTGEIIPNATVKVFNHIDDWAFEENLRQTLKSDAKGEIKLRGLSEGNYFLDVIKDDMSNWQNPRDIPVYQGELYFDQVGITVNFNYFISSVEGKDWEITKISDEFDNDLSDDPDLSCMVGNVVHFEKDGYYTMDDGTDRCDNLPQLREASWWGYDQNLSLLINGKDIHDYFIDPFYDDYFILNDYSGEEIIKFRYERI